MNTNTYGIGDTVFGEADFGNTLEVIGVDLRDNNGNLLTGDSITGDSGNSYAITLVPEPSSVLLFGFGSLSLAFRRLRSRR